MKNKRIPKVNPEATFREEFDGWGIIFNPDTGDIFGLNPVSALIWKNINGRNTIRDIYSKIKDTVTDMPDNSLAQIENYINQLAQKALISY